MAFAFLQSLSVEQNIDADDESDIEVGEMSDDEEQDSDQDSSSLDLANSGEDWTDVLVDVTDKLEPFSEFSGPVHDLPTDSQPLDYFKLFFPIDILERMVTETNRYAEQQQQLKGARAAYWKSATLSDIRKYIYTLVTFGHHVLPETCLYWSEDSYWRVPAIADVWGRQRYRKIHQYFHLMNSEDQPARDDENHDPLFKVRFLLDDIRNV